MRLTNLSGDYRTCRLAEVLCESDLLSTLQIHTTPTVGLLKKLIKVLLVQPQLFVPREPATEFGLTDVLVIAQNHS